MAGTCFLFGHRDAPASVLPEIERAVEAYYLNYGVHEFVVGHRGSFDHLAAQAVRAVQKAHPEIHLTLLLAYPPSSQSSALLAAYDSWLYPDCMENVPARFVIPRSNQHMIDHADAFICYVIHEGNTRALLDRANMRAAKTDVPLVNLAISSRLP